MVRGFSITIGLVVGIIANVLITQISMAIYSSPQDFDLSDPEQLSMWMEQMSSIQKLWVFTAHIIQAAVGSFAGGWVNRMTAQRTGLIVGAISAVFSAMNLTQSTHPEWFWLEVPLCIVLGAGVGRLLQRSEDL